MHDDDWMPHLRKWRRLEKEMDEWITISEKDLKERRHISVIPSTYLPEPPDSDGSGVTITHH
jgi:hypothetical protein